MLARICGPKRSGLKWPYVFLKERCELRRRRHHQEAAAGYACATCQVAETGYTGPNSEINAFSSAQSGVVPGRFSDRKPQSYLYGRAQSRGPLLRPRSTDLAGRQFLGWSRFRSRQARTGGSPSGGATKSISCFVSFPETRRATSRPELSGNI